ncbi:MAG TPA: zinc-dependent alcohol dehydrogenase family protein [Kineosporiaceae bacterium]|nr:zinc-dependent alcohol dehydrogenase family protein [Kineosporiaceae bacterium]
MRALVMEEFGAAPRLREVPDPVCPPDGVVVRVEATGLCRSDWHALAGHDPDVVLPHVPGHEFAGVVHEVGAAVAGWSPGERVTAPFVHACGDCPVCRAGDHQVCPRQTQPGFSRWGSFAELVVVERAAVNLVRLPDAVDTVTAAALGCRYATAFRAVVQVGRVRAGEWVAVHGCGGVGLSAVQVARQAGARVVAVDVRDEALQVAAALGAELTMNAAALTRDDPLGEASEAGGPDDVLSRQRAATRVAQAVREATGGGAALSLDALGHPATAAASIGGLRPRGRHVQVGLLPPALGWPALPMHLVIGGELELLGSHGMAAHGYPALLELVAAGRLDPGGLVTATIGLAQAGPELAAMGERPPTGVTMIDPRR